MAGTAAESPLIPEKVSRKLASGTQPPVRPGLLTRPTIRTAHSHVARALANVFRACSASSAPILASARPPPHDGLDLHGVGQYHGPETPKHAAVGEPSRPLRLRITLLSRLDADRSGYSS